MDTQAIHKKLTSNFNSIYITLISIIQSALFGNLLTHYPDFNNDSCFYQELVRFSICFLSIFLVWNEYRIGASIYSWIPTMKDGMIPLFITGIQFGMINNIEINEGVNCFILFNFLFWVSGIFAYGNMYSNVSQFEEINEDVYEYSLEDRIVNTKFILFFLCVFLLSFIFLRLKLISITLFEFLLLGLFLRMIFFRERRFKRLINWKLS